MRPAILFCEPAREARARKLVAERQRAERLVEIVNRAEVICPSCQRPVESTDVFADVLADTITCQVRCHTMGAVVVISRDKLLDGTSLEDLIMAELRRGCCPGG